jgi:hypothetical protein
MKQQEEARDSSVTNSIPKPSYFNSTSGLVNFIIILMLLRPKRFFNFFTWIAGNVEARIGRPCSEMNLKREDIYDPYSYLPVMAGVPLQSAEASEKFLHDVERNDCRIGQ